MYVDPACPLRAVPVEIATRNVIFPGSVGLAQAHPLTKPLAMGDGVPPDLVQILSTLPIRALVLAIVKWNFIIELCPNTGSWDKTLEHFPRDYLNNDHWLTCRGVRALAGTCDEDGDV